MALLLIIAGWAITNGSLEIISALELRKHLFICVHPWFPYGAGCGTNVGPAHRGPSGVQSNLSTHICRTRIAGSQA